MAEYVATLKPLTFQSRSRAVALRIITVVSLALVVVAAREQPTFSAREILEAHLSHGIGDSPFDSNVWRDETNAALIVAARSGVRRDALERLAGSREDLDSRLEILRQKGFLRPDGAMVRTTFPILVGQAHQRYMRLISDAARRINMQAKWQALLADLADRNWADWSYHFVWSQTMDSGFAWAAMMEQGRVPPLSTVIVWVVHPAHPFKSGTNYYPDTEIRDRMLAVTWRPGAADTVGRFAQAWPMVWSAALTGEATTEARKQLGALGLVDRSGRIRVPVVTKEDGLYKRLETLANEHVRLVARYLPLLEVRALTGNDDQVAFAMAYHDVGWEVLKRMVASGMVTPPPALRERAPENLSMAGVCAIIDTHPEIEREIRKALGIQ